MGTDSIDNLFDKEIRQISELKRMARVPRLFELMRDIVKAYEANVSDNKLHQNGTASKSPRTPVKPSNPPSGRPNGLTQAGLKAMRSMHGTFTTLDVEQKMKRSGFTFESGKPRVALHSVFKRGMKMGLIRMVEKNAGKKAHKYELIDSFKGDLS